jgi:DNA-binding transcriptional LysR family regulator
VLNFNHVYYFHVAATEGSIKAAAERLGVTQPTVSEQIRLLEKSLGVTLFERASSGLLLTPVGRDAFEQTKAMFLAGERFAEAVGRSDGSTSVPLRIGMSAAISRTVAADFLMPVLTIDRCRPTIRTGEFSELVRDLRNHELDLVIGESESLPISKAELEVTVLHEPVLVAITSADARPKDDWSDLRLLEFRPSSAYHWDVDAFLKEKSLRPSTSAELDDAFLMLEAVSRGGFVAFVPFSVARERIKAGQVKRIATIRPTAKVHAVFHSSDTRHIARSAVEKLVANARDYTDAE